MAEGLAFAREAMGVLQNTQFQDLKQRAQEIEERMVSWMHEEARALADLKERERTQGPAPPKPPSAS